MIFTTHCEVSIVFMQFLLVCRWSINTHVLRNTWLGLLCQKYSPCLELKGSGKIPIEEGGGGSSLIFLTKVMSFHLDHQ